MLQQLRIKTRILLIVFGIILLFAVMTLFAYNIAGQIRDLGTAETAKVMLTDQKAKLQVVPVMPWPSPWVRP